MVLNRKSWKYCNFNIKDFTKNIRNTERLSERIDNIYVRKTSI